MPAVAAIPAGYLAAASIAATVVGAGVSYMGAQQAAQASAAQQSYNAEVAANNQVTANAAAVTAQQQGAVQAQEKAFATAQLEGRQKAGLAANGVDVNSGSAVDLLSDTAAAGELDQLTITNNAARTAVGFQNQGIGYQNQATLDEASSADALQGGALKADASIIQGAGSVASTWYNTQYGQRLSGMGSLQ